MAQPVAFSVVAVLLTLGLLVLARRSQDQLGPDGEIELPNRPAPSGADSEVADPRTPPKQTSVPLRAHDYGSVPTDTADLTPTPEQRAVETKSVSSPQTVELTPKMVIANVAFTQGLVGGIVLAAGWYFAISSEAFGVTADSLSTGLPAVALGVGFGAVLWIGNELATTIADAVGAAYDEGVRQLLAPESPGGWLLLFGVVLPIIALSEELLFRAALIGIPAANFAVSPWLLAVVASIAFALGHGAQGRVGVVVTGLLGFVLAAGYILSGSLLVVVVAHYVINGLEFLVHEYFEVDLLTGLTNS